MSPQERKIQEGDSNPPEVHHVLRVDPTELLENNPAGLIYNRETIKQLTAGFAWGRFGRPEVAQVDYISSDGQLAAKLLVVDGFNRIKFAADYKGKALPNRSDVIIGDIEVYDATQDLLDNPLVVPAQERQLDQTTLTLMQYLRAVVPPTRVHAEIAPDRIAAHLINAWQTMVGEELSNKFSALAALSTLKQTHDYFKPKRYRIEENPFFADENAEERARLFTAINNLEAIINEARLSPDSVLKAAFSLARVSSAIIGGESKSTKEIYGLLFVPAVDQKLKAAYPDNVAQREQARMILGQTVIQVMTKSLKQSDNVVDYLIDPSLDLTDTVHVISSDDPKSEYDDTTSRRTEEALGKAYLAATKKDDLSAFESHLIKSLGHQPSLGGRSVESAVQTVSGVMQTLTSLQALETHLLANRQELVASGVDSDFIDRSLEWIKLTPDRILNYHTFDTVTQQNKRIQSAIAEIEQTIIRSTRIHLVSTIVYSELGTVDPTAVSFLMTELNLADKAITPDESRIKARLNDFMDLDADLRNEVASNLLRLDVALRRQVSRLGSPVRPTGAESEGQSLQKPLKIHSAVEESKAKLPSDILSAQTETEKVKPTAATKDFRVENNNRELSDIIRALSQKLERLDLDPKEVSAEVKEEAYPVLIKLGKLIFDHPDIVRVLLDEYPNLLTKFRSLQEARVQGDIADTASMTKTGQ